MFWQRNGLSSGVEKAVFWACLCSLTLCPLLNRKPALCGKSILVIVGGVGSTTETRWTQRPEKTSLLEISGVIVPHGCGNRRICTAEIRRPQRITFRFLLSNRRPALCGRSNLVMAGGGRSTTEARWKQRSEKNSLLEISGFIVPHDCGNRGVAPLRFGERRDKPSDLCFLPILLRGYAVAVPGWLSGSRRWRRGCCPLLHLPTDLSSGAIREDRAFAEAAEDEPDREDGWEDGTREAGVRLSDHPISTAWERMWGFGFSRGMDCVQALGEWEWCQ